jgi:hypothetical protein
LNPGDFVVYWAKAFPDEKILIEGKKSFGIRADRDQIPPGCLVLLINDGR